MSKHLVRPSLVLLGALVLLVITLALSPAPMSVDAAGKPTKAPTKTATPPGPTPTQTPTSIPPTPTNTPTPGSCGSTRNINVATAAELTSALSGAQPGDIITMAAGTYSGHFVATVGGTSTCHIVLMGPSTAVMDGGDKTTGYGFNLKANYWELRGFTVTNSQKGIVFDTASYSVIDTISVHDVGMEGIHMRTSSTHNTIQNNTVTNTGQFDAGFGEGIYLGSADSNNSSDYSDYNQVLNNHVGPGVTAECVDIKEHTTGGIIDGNYFDATGISGQNYGDSWIDAKGNGYTISNNTGVNPTGNTKMVDGVQIHQAVSGWGNNNTFKRNNFDVRSTGYGFNVQSGTTGNKVCTDNTVTNAASGFSNVTPVTCP